MFGQIEQRNKKVIMYYLCCLPVQALAQGSLMICLPQLRRHLQKREELRLQLIATKINFYLVDNVFISICSRYLSFLHKAADELAAMKPENL